MAPELCKEYAYDNKVDCWAMGVISFACLTGNAPFVGKTKPSIYEAICKKEPKWEKLSKCS